MRLGGLLRQVQGTHGGAERMACPACEFVHWDNPVPVVAAIVEHEGAVILARNRNWPPKMFGLVTGFLEKDETPEAGIVREVKEELGLDALGTSFIGLYPFARANELIIAFHVPAEGTIVLNEELADIRRVPPGRLQPWDFGTGLAVADWLRERDAP